jgi:hypothetical protein
MVGSRPPGMRDGLGTEVRGRSGGWFGEAGVVFFLVLDL